MTDPDDAHWRALVEFRARHGRAWRDTLSIYWMNGRDASEPHGAALRWIRNHLGPSWLCDLPDSDIETQALRLRLADTLPEMCATLLPSTLEPVAIKRGEKGYWPLPDGMTVECINEIFSATAAQIAAMEIGSLFGWDVPGADPSRYDETGKPQSIASR